MSKKQHPIVEICRSVLSGKLSIIAAARELRDYRDNFSIKNYDDILFFDTIAAQTEHLPLGKVRKHWNKERLKEKDKERKIFEAKYEINVGKACKRLIEEFDI